MRLATKYILWKFIKNFLIILLSMELFFVGIDFLQTVKSLPNSANLQLLYILYNGFFTLTITLPLSIVFGWVLTLTSMIKENSLVSFYALGLSKRDILIPVVVASVFITSILIALQSTPLAYSYEEKTKILKNKYFANTQNNIFLKYNEYFIYFNKLYPLQKKATNIHIFKVKNTDIVETIVAKKALFQDNVWKIVDTKITKKPTTMNWDNTKISVRFDKFRSTLKGFEPAIISNVYKGNAQYSVIDAIRTIVLLDTQEFNTNKIKAILYSQIVQPFFVLPMIILIFIFAGASSRFFNSAIFISLSIFSTLAVWGSLFLLQKLALGGVIIAEVAIILPIVTLFIISLLIYKKRVI